MVAGRRYMAEQMAKYKPVYSYRFNQSPDNVTIEIGVSAVSLGPGQMSSLSFPASSCRPPTTQRSHLSLAYVPESATHVPDEY